jgi:hypothetical protein
MRASDHIVDIGPGAGEHGGYVVAEGSMDDIIAASDSLTGQYLSGRRSIRFQRNGGRVPVRSLLCAVLVPITCVTSTPPSPRNIHLCNRRIWVRQEHPGERDLVQGSRSTTTAQARPTGRPRQRRWTGARIRLSTLINLRLVARRALTLRHTLGHLRLSGSCSHKCRKPRSVATSRGDSRSMSRVADVKRVEARESSRSRCTSCLTSMCRARSAGQALQPGGA